MLRHALLLLGIATASYAASIGQIDDFEDGTTMGWAVPGPHPAPPTNINTGGPAGVGDNYLQLTALGEGGPGSRMAVLNEAQWSGNYTAVGLAYISMDVNNFGPNDLYLRLLFEDFPATPGPPQNLALSADAIFVPAGSGWVKAIFPVMPSALVGGGLGTVEGALASVDTIRIFHNPDPTFPGPGMGIPTVNAVLGVDNVTASAVPEPASWGLAGAGLALALLRKRLRA